MTIIYHELENTQVNVELKEKQIRWLRIKLRRLIRSLPTEHPERIEEHGL